MHECVISHHVWLNSGQRYSSSVTVVTLGWPPWAYVMCFAFFSFMLCFFYVFFYVMMYVLSLCFVTPAKYKQKKTCIEIKDLLLITA